MQHGNIEPTHIMGDVRFHTSYGLDHLLATLDRWHAAAREALKQEMEDRTAQAGSISLGVLNYDPPTYTLAE